MKRRIKTIVADNIANVMDIQPLDPLNINARLQLWVSELIENRADMTTAEQVRAIAAIGRIQYVFMKLREEKFEPVNTGTAVKRYEKAFASNAARRRKAVARKSGTLPAILEDADDLEL